MIHVASLQQHLGVPRALGTLSLRAVPSHPVKRTETADMSVRGDKGMTRGLAAQRELEAAAHRLSWDPWLSTSAGLPLSITTREENRAGLTGRQRCPSYSTSPTSH